MCDSVAYWRKVRFMQNFEEQKYSLMIWRDFIISKQS